MPAGVAPVQVRQSVCSSQNTPTGVMKAGSSAMIAVPLATQAGWNYRDASIGSPDRLAGEIGSYIPFARTKAERDKTNDPRLSIEERYRNRDEYVGRFAASALDLVARGYLLPEDVADLLKHAVEHYDWATTAKH